MTRLIGMMERGCAAAALLLISAAAVAQNSETSADPGHPSRFEETRKEAGTIITQPARDVGVSKTVIPPLLVKAADDPYGLGGLKSCRQIAGAVRELDEVLGPDFTAHKAYRENRAGKLAKEGGETVINSFIPFRGLVREVTGAAPAERRREAAIAVGYARRGFLRGVMQGRGCRG